MPTPFQILHARYKREAEAEKPTAKRRARRKTTSTPPATDPGAATEPLPTGEEDDS